MAEAHPKKTKFIFPLLLALVFTSVLFQTSNLMLTTVNVAAAPSSSAIEEETLDLDAQSDTQPVHHLTMFKGCRARSDIVECFQSCWDEYKLSSIFRAALQLKGKRVNITKYLWERYNKTMNKNDRYGCLVGCLTNTPRGICKGQCTPPLKHYIGEKCVNHENDTNIHFKGVNGSITEEFKNCTITLLNTTEDAITLCDRNTALLDNTDRTVKRALCIEAVEYCVNTLNNNPNVSSRSFKNFTLCVEYYMMEEHLLLAQKSNYCGEYIASRPKPDPVRENHEEENPNQGGVTTSAAPPVGTTTDPSSTTTTSTTTAATTTPTPAPIGATTPAPSPSPTPPPPSPREESKEEELAAGKCDMDVIRKFLPNEDCEYMCDEISPKTPFDHCVDRCDKLSYPLCYEACVTDVECFQRCDTPNATTIGGMPSLTLHCFAHCDGDYEQKHPIWVNKSTSRTYKQILAEQYCRKDATSENIQELAETVIKDVALRKLVFENYDVEDYGWLFQYKLPEECYDHCKLQDSPRHLKECLWDNNCITPLSMENRDELCAHNPLRIVVHVQYAASLGLTMKHSVVKESNFKMKPGDEEMVRSAYLFNGTDDDRNERFKVIMGFKRSEKECNRTCGNEDIIGISNAQCTIDCFKEHGERCIHDQLKNADLTDFSTCQWQVNLAYTSDPKDILGTYFNDKASYDEKDKLERPETTQFLQQTTLRDNGSTGYFVFPYFIIIRATCDSSNYDEAFYRLLMSGTYPEMIVSYRPHTGRDAYQSSLQTVFESSLINLKRTTDDILVPHNPLDRRKEEELSQDDIVEVWCHLKLCYPAFAIPHPMYQLPIFEISIPAQDVFEELAHHVFVTSFHLTSATGSGELYVSDAHENVVSVATPRDFFPGNKITQVEDASLAERRDFCDLHEGVCPTIEDDPDELYIDHEDILDVHFTYPTAPQIAIAGFYSPNLLIIGDPDMTKFDLVNWTIPTPKHNVPLFGEDHPCVHQKQYKNSKTGKTLTKTIPLYSKIDYSDDEYPINYYRMRYAHKAYEKAPNGHGIFDVIALEDRFLLVTANGLVAIYGNTNATLSAQKAFKVDASEKLKKCFKFMRTAKVSQSPADMIVGVTYNYDYHNITAQSEDENRKGYTDYIRQEIWYGRLTRSGEGLGWAQLRSSSNVVDDEDVEYSIPSEPDSGNVVPLAPGKPFRPPPLNSDSLSEVEFICYKVYKEKISMKDVHINRYLEGWCEALDATPVVTKKDTIQLLIRMTVMYNGIGSTGSGTKIVLYVLASHTVDAEKKSNRNEKLLWFIDSVIPRIPCIGAHKESVKNLQGFNNEYFTTTSPVINGTGLLYGCHAIFNDTFARQYHIYVNRLTYTATYTNHMYLYGARLAHSTDAGKTFVGNTQFPGKMGDPTRQSQSHRIMTMAFGQSGQFTFLTNERELWIGNTGTTDLIRLRPSPGFYAIQTIVSHQRGLQDGIPFAVLYEYSEELYEMVALPGKDGKIEAILKREVPVSVILKQTHLMDQVESSKIFLRKYAVQQIRKGEERPRFHDFSVRTDSSWYLYCPFSSPSFTENYTAKYSRNQLFSFAPPDQHPALSNYTRTSEFRTLIAYQVVSFNLIWKSFFDISYSPYSGVEWEPFGLFQKNKEENASIGELFYRSIPRDDIYTEEVAERAKTNGIHLFPHHYSRVSTDHESDGIQDAFYLDYGKAIRLHLKFSIKNPSSLINTDYFAQHIADIQMNVDSGNGSLLLIDNERSVPGAEASVEFTIIISIIKSDKMLLEQNEPGKNLLPIPVFFHFIGAFGSCIQTPENRLVKDTLRTTVFVGCLPETDLLFNWNSTLHSIKFRDRNEHYGKQEDCYDNVLVCFFARLPMIFFFDVYDIAKQRSEPFTGNYIMRIVGGGYSNDTIKSYDKLEIEAYNIPGVSDVSLIWNEWDLEKQKKVDRQSNMWSEPDAHKKATVKETSKEIVLTSGKSAVQWACHTLSPCARVAPNIQLEAVYWFEIQVTNKGVDNSTLCLFDKKFTIMLYGFPPSPETQLLTTIIFCLVMIGILYILFICLRGHKRVWRTTKIKLYGWYQIVKDTFPKPLRKHQAESQTVGHTQEEKDNIILSLQGHLKIPPLIGRVDESRGGSPRSMTSGTVSPVGRMYGREGDRMSGNSVASSEASLGSRFSRSQLEILNPVAARHGPATWTDMVYEQIIAKRLSAIVDKNNKMRQNILRRVSVHDATDEHEGNYEKEYKRTISQESIFAQPQ